MLTSFRKVKLPKRKIVRRKCTKSVIHSDLLVKSLTCHIDKVLQYNPSDWFDCVDEKSDANFLIEEVKSTVIRHGTTVIVINQNNPLLHIIIPPFSSEYIPLYK